MKIVVIGGGWYGMHIYRVLKKCDKVDLLVLEKNTLFEGSSLNNQNRLHLGYHYPRSFKTRTLCMKYYKEFIKNYGSTVDDIEKNIYAIAQGSNLDYGTYIKIFSDIDMYNHTVKENTLLEDVDGELIETNEKFINATKAKDFFNNLIDEGDIRLNYEVTDIHKVNNKLLINNEIECDLILDCTFNQLQLSRKKYTYELTISLVYENINETSFGALTIMDGNFFSIFPRDIKAKTYTLTHVKYTPLLKSDNLQEILDYNVTDENVKGVIENMESEVLKMYKSFNENFVYKYYFLSYKCKPLSNCDTRECNIENNDGIISVNCGKISGIFEFEEYIADYLNKIHAIKI